METLAVSAYKKISLNIQDSSLRYLFILLAGVQGYD